jgi:hypothetical protein
MMIKSLIPAVLIASALAVPTFASAQDSAGNSGVTRAEVKGQLIQLEQAGYNPTGRDNYYPSDVQAAQRRVDAANGNDRSAYGPSTSGTSASGIHVNTTQEPVITRSLYSGH